MCVYNTISSNYNKKIEMYNLNSLFQKYLLYHTHFNKKNVSRTPLCMSGQQF